MTLLKLLLKFLILWHRQCSIVNGKWLADTSVKYTGVPATRRLPRADNSVIVPRANTYVPSCTDCIQRQTWEGMRFVHCKWDLYAVAYRRWSGGGAKWTSVLDLFVVLGMKCKDQYWKPTINGAVGGIEFASFTGIDPGHAHVYAATDCRSLMKWPTFKLYN